MDDPPAGGHERVAVGWQPSVAPAGGQRSWQPVIGALATAPPAGDDRAIATAPAPAPAWPVAEPAPYDYSYSPTTAPAGAPSYAPGPALGPGWPPSPPDAYLPAQLPRSAVPKKRTIALIVGGVVLVALVLVALAVPTFRAVEAKQAGTAWFTGGVPGWPTISVNGTKTDGALVEAWAVPGPMFAGEGPFLAVIKLQTPADWVAGQTTTQWLLGTQQRLLAQGVGQAQMVTLADGSPALQWTRADHPLDLPNVDITDYVLFAQRDNGFYMVYFATETPDFTSELSVARPVMFNFKGTGN